MYELQKRKSKISREAFAEAIVTGKTLTQAYVDAGGASNKGTLAAAHKLKKTDEVQALLKEKTLQIAHEAVLQEARLAPLAIEVLQEIMSNPKADIRMRKAAADSVLSRVGNILPKELNINTTNTNVDIDFNELAKNLLEANPDFGRGIEESASGEVIDVELCDSGEEEQST